MPLAFHEELSVLSRTKKIVSLLPAAARFRVAKKMYNYESDRLNGIDIVAPLQKDGLVCLVNTKDLIGWKIFFFGEYEQDTNQVLAKYLKEDFVVIEAGANIGSESLLISRLAPQGKVYCFEPNPYTFDRLKINIAINELNNVYAYDYALGEADGAIHFNIYPKGFCNAGMSSKYMETPLTKKITVTQKTLDNFVKEQQIERVDFIKMDIQGAEMDMIKGSLETIARFKPIIFTEACEPYNDTNKLYELLKSYGYKIHLIGKTGIEEMKNAAEVKDGNWLCQ